MRLALYSLSTLALLVCSSTTLVAQSSPAPAEKFVTEKQLEDAKADALKSGDTAWMLISSGLVMLMVPGLALFYAGMVRRKNVLATMMHSMAALSVVGVYWVAIGYSLAFGESVHGLFGWSSKLLFLHGVEVKDMLPNTNITVYAHVMFQGMFAIITPALISGAIAERIRFGPYCLFLLLWVTLVYCPLAHWVWAMNWWDADPAVAGKNLVGWLGKLPKDGGIGAIDFAGGTVVHIAAGFSGLAAILMLRKRLGYPDYVIQPNSMVLTLLGAGLLWFGWFGFNGGSALGSGQLATSAFSATQAAAAAAGLSWMLAETFHKGKPTALGLASGIVAGLVAVTPASGYVYIWGGLAIGLIAGVFCYISVCLKPIFKYDDSLDAFGVHGVGGFLGALLTGVFCYKAVNPDAVPSEGVLAGGGITQLVAQLTASVAAAIFSFALSVVLVKLVDLVFGFVTDAKSETQGLDVTEHGELGFDLGPELELAPERAGQEPRAATRPPNGQERFTVVIEGADHEKLAAAWHDLCRVDGTPLHSPEFKAIYPFLTTVQGNRFRFRGGDINKVRENLLQLLKPKLGTSSVRVQVLQS